MNGASGTAPSLPQASLGEANTVVLAVHGVGDHSQVDLLSTAESCAAAIWGNRASTSRIGLSDIPMPRDINFVGFSGDELEGLEIRVDQGTHVIIPLIWSGYRFRSGRMASVERGPKAFWMAFPIMLATCIDLFRSVPKARGFWIAGVMCLALALIGFFVAFAVLFWYLELQAVLWMQPYYQTWFGPLLIVGSVSALGWLAKRFAVTFDLIGDVAHYISSPDDRQENVAEIAALFQRVAERAPNARIVVAGHSLGSVLVSQALLRTSPTYSGHGRTLLLTMGSPLSILSKVFPKHVESPSQAAACFGASGVILKWVNLWRDQDFIGKALGAQANASFVEASLGSGRHANYWGDERVWMTVAAVLETLPSSHLEGAVNAWRAVALTEYEKNRVRAMFRIMRRGRVVCGLMSFLMVFAVFQIHGLLEQEFTVAQRVLVLAAWSVGVLGLLLAAFCLEPGALMLSPTFRQALPRDLMYRLEFNLARGRVLATSASIYLAIWFGILATKFYLDWRASN